MKTLLGWIALAALALPAQALAGVGATAHLGGLSDGSTKAPTLDYRTHGWLIQLDVLDLVGYLPSDQMDVQIDVTKNVLKKKKDDVGKQVEGVFMPGAGFRVVNWSKLDETRYNFVVESRLGAEMKNDVGFGMYVVPMIGVGNIGGLTTGSDKMSVAWGGGLQVSAWVK